MLPVALLPEAAEEWDDATDFYENRSAGLGEEFRSAVLAIFDAIAENPRKFPRTVRHYRRAVLRRFPYVVFFTVEQDGILVVAVLHGRRDPAVIKERLL